MKKITLLYIISVFIFLSNNILISQGMIVNTPLDKRIEHSSYVIEGMVVEKKCAWDNDFKYIYTVNTVLVLNEIKGSIESDTINVITPGGIVGYDKIVAFPSLNLMINDIGLFILNKKNIRFEKKVNGFQNFKPQYSRLSFIEYNLDELSAFDDFNKYPDIQRDIYGKLISMGYRFDNRLLSYINFKIHQRSPDAVSISSFSPAVITAGSQSVLTISGSGFGYSQGSGIVEFRDADNGGSEYMSPIASEYVSWSNTQIKVEVPSGAGTGDIKVTNNSGESDVSNSDLTVTYNLTNVEHEGEKYRPNLVDADGSGGIEFVFYTDFFNDAAAMDAFMRALDSWRCGDGTGVYFENGGSSNVDEEAKDGVNIIRFDNGNELEEGVLGKAMVYWTGCSTGSSISWYAKEIDITFDDNAGGDGISWNFDEADGSTGSNEIDFESVALHELGHGHQLGHVIDPSQVMHYSIGNGQEKRTLSTDDLDAGNDVLDFSTGVCNQADMSTYVCNSQPIELLYFDGEQIDENIKLKWGFASILDLDHVDVLKSTTGTDFSIVKTFKNVGSDRDFEYVDYSKARENYYRLQYVDIDGIVKKSKIIYIFNDNNDIEINIYPNPAKDVIYVENIGKDNPTFLLYNSKGTILKEWKSGERMDVSFLPEGVYFLKVTTSSDTVVKKIYKL